MWEIIRDIIPDSLGGEIHGDDMSSSLKVLESVGIFIATATDITTDHADPNILYGLAMVAFDVIVIFLNWEAGWAWVLGAHENFVIDDALGESRNIELESDEAGKAGGELDINLFVDRLGLIL